MDALTGLQKDLEKAESSLKSVDSKIKEATGFDPNERRARIVSRVGTSNVSLKRPFERRISQGDEGTDAKRYRGDDPAESAPTRQVRRTVHMPGARQNREERVSQSLQSSVVRSVPERPPRSAGQTDPRSMARNRRMFGMLMGTLQKFKSDDSAATAQVEKQKEIDARLEETRKKDREETVKRRDDLYRERREQTAARNQIQNQIELVELKKEWIEHKDELKKSNFILSKAQPPIFYAPAKHTDATQKLVEETHRRLDEETARRHDAMLSAASQSKTEEKGDRKQQIAVSSGSAGDEDGLTFDAAADGITGLPGVEEEEEEVTIKADEESMLVSDVQVKSEALKSEPAEDECRRQDDTGSPS